MYRAAQDTENDSQFASTLAQGLDVLACFAPGATVLGNKDFASKTGLSPSTVARVTHTLLKQGYLRRVPGSRKYRPGLKLLALTYPMLASLRLRQIAQSLMQSLAMQINGAVSLVMRDGLDMVYVETARANERMQTHPDIGATLPMLSSAAGKAWLCKAPMAERQAILNQLRLAQPEAYAQHAAQLDAAVRQYEQFGFCTNERQWRADIYGFAVPVKRLVDSNLYVFNCGVPSTSGPFAARCQDITPRLLHLVRGAEVLLGLR